jgi:peptidoglycan/LPS O-acetylase OafA/YrhL
VLWGPLRFFGDISYGLYLLHLLLFIAYDRAIQKIAPHFADYQHRFGSLCLRFLVAATASVLLAWFSRGYFEEPFLKLKLRFAA